MKIGWGAVAMIFIIIGMSYVYRYQSELKMDEPEIRIHVRKNPLITSEEIRNILKSEQLYYPEILFKKLNTKSIEQRLKRIPEVEKVDVFTHFGTSWTIDIVQRDPIVKVINQHNDKYYIDQYGTIFRAKPEHSARVLIANGKIKERPEAINLKYIINNDSLKTIHKIDDIYRISKYVCKNSFLEAQICQIFVEKNGEIILIPQIGDQIIVFGSANTEKEVKEKFEKLIKFYQKGIVYEGWKKYKEINLKYSGQVVCKKN